MRKGWLFTKDFYVPIGAIDTVAEDGITLKLSRDVLDNESYSQPPTASKAALDPVVLADGSIIAAGVDSSAPTAKNQEKDVDWKQSDSMPLSSPEISDELREDQRFRAR